MNRETLRRRFWWLPATVMAAAAWCCLQWWPEIGSVPVIVVTYPMTVVVLRGADCLVAVTAERRHERRILERIQICDTSRRRAA